MKKSVRDLLESANGVVTTLDVAHAMELVGDESVVFVDVRDRNEVEAHGMIPGAVHAPRGMLEFHIDPASPVHIDVLSGKGRLLFYCGSGGRSVLAAHTALEMGCEDVAHIGGGFGRWLEAGGPVKKKGREGDGFG